MYEAHQRVSDHLKPLHRRTASPSIVNCPMSELDEQISMGWGSTQGTLIPPDWRDRRGPDRI
jgi:hypothetical protein